MKDRPIHGPLPVMMLKCFPAFSETAQSRDVPEFNHCVYYNCSLKYRGNSFHLEVSMVKN